MFKLFVHANERGCYSSPTSTSATGIFRSRPSFPGSSSINLGDNSARIIMAKGQRPPPLNLSVDARPRSLPRISRTPATKEEEATPLLTPLPEDDYEDPPEPIVRVVRIAIDFMHLVACMMLAVMMITFLTTYTQAAQSGYRLKAAFLLTALGSDVILDVRSIRFHDRSWSDWTLLSRTLAASIYLGILIAFVLADRVFPADYSYWNMGPEEAGGPVLGLLWVILGWDIVHLILSQHRAGWWWTWLQARWHCGRTKMESGRERHSRGRVSRRTMQSWSCAS